MNGSCLLGMGPPLRPTHHCLSIQLTCFGSQKTSRKGGSASPTSQGPKGHAQSHGEDVGVT